MFSVQIPIQPELASAAQSKQKEGEEAALGGIWRPSVLSECERHRQASKTQADTSRPAPAREYNKPRLLGDHNICRTHLNLNE